MRYRLLCLFALLIASPILGAEPPQLPHIGGAPVERNGFSHLTSYDSLQSFLREISRSSVTRLETIGTTREGRSVSAVRVAPTEQSHGTEKLRVLLFAQQHGDEPSGKEALTMLLAKCASGENAAALTQIELCVVPQMNPDGGERRQRRTSDSVDLNRSHLLLNSPETSALHELFLSWQPHVTLDIHEYGAYSRSWADAGYSKRGDVQLGTLTNLNSSGILRKYQHDSVLTFVAGRMKDNRYTFHEYIVGSPGDRIRHSTTEINDGRQSFGILNTLSFIQEGRQGRSLEEGLERRARSQLAAIEALLSYCNGHAQEIRDLVAGERHKLSTSAGSRFALRMEHVHGDGVLRIPVQTVPAGRDTVISATPYHDLVRPVAETTVPSGYVIPAGERSIIELLRRHHVKGETVERERAANVETYWIDSVGTDVLEEDSLPRPFVRRERSVITLQPGDLVVSTAQWHGMFLPTLLEPESMWGLTKYSTFSGLLRQKRYPISRIP
jgi:Zinc carboxypeptidase